MTYYAYPSVSNAPSTPGLHEYWNTFDSAASIAPGDVYVVAHPSSDTTILEQADETHYYLLMVMMVMLWLSVLKRLMSF